MSERDERMVSALRELVDLAPIEADVWADSERRVARRTRRRRTMGAIAVVVVVGVVGAVATGTLATTKSTKHVQVATTTPTTERAGTTNAPTTTTPTTATPTTSLAIVAPTTLSTTPAATPTVDVCPDQCVGRASADVDGDGRLDEIGLSASPALSGDIVAGKPSALLVRVLFADGRVTEHHDSADWDASLIGAADVNGDGRAEIFYFNNTGANLHSGPILRWDGANLAVVLGPDGKPFSTFTSGYALGGDGFRCAGNAFFTMNINDDGPPSHWNATQTAYNWKDGRLVKVSAEQPIPLTQPPPGSSPGTTPVEYDQIIGAHCGLASGYP
jgi:hypothetical protein